LKSTAVTAIVCAAATATVVAALVGCEPSRPTSRPAAIATPAAEPTTQAAATPAPTPAPATQPAVALVNGQPITLEELQKPLLEAYGMPILLNLVRLNLARQEAAQAKVTVTPADIDRERQLMFQKLFKDVDAKDYDRLLDQLLARQRVTRPEFDLIIETTAYLRKIAEPLLKDKINDQALQDAFRTLYGENVEVRDIQLANLQEVAQVRQRLDAGEPFAQIARELSRDPRTKAEGGLLPPFSREFTNLSPAFKDAAFALKEPGDVSDPVQTGDAFHLIQLVRKIPPRAVKFEDVKESVRAELYDRLMEATTTQLRKELDRRIMQVLDVRDPILKKQLDLMIGRQQAEARDRDKARLEIEKQRQELSQQQGLPVAPATQQSAAPDATPGGTGAPAATSTEARERPPATKSGQ
jgi:parvulin-like peptidyl-prolyl isomerase